MSLLEARGLSKAFGGVKAIDDFSFEVADHDVVGIIGPNGAGKTTVFNLLTGVYRLDAGKVVLEEEI